VNALSSHNESSKRFNGATTAVVIKESAREAVMNAYVPKISGQALGLAKVPLGSAEEADRVIQIMSQATLNGKVLVVFQEPD
jgi:hypothetical protein